MIYPVTMKTGVLVAGSIFIFIAGLIHIYIFTLESLTWINPKTYKKFGIRSQEEAKVISSMAFNQGFYNLFLAIGSFVGVALLSSHRPIGLTLIFFSAGSMVAAALVLLSSVKNSGRAALVQSASPLIGIVLLVISLSTN